MKNKVIIMSGGIAVFTSFAIAGIALAASMTGGVAMQGDSMMHNDKTPSSMMMMHPPAPMILTVTGDGTGRLRGVVVSVSATSTTVAGWGGIWTIHVVSDTKMLPKGTSLSDIKVGDFIGAMGTVSEDSPTMTASIIRDWTAKAAMMHDSTMKGDHMMATSSGAMMH